MDEEGYNNEDMVDFGDEYAQEYDEPAMEAEEDGLGVPGQQQATEQAMERTTSSRHEQEDQTQSLKRKLMDSLKEANKWRTAFKEVATLVGFTTGVARDPDVEAVVETVQRLKTQGQAMQEEIRQLHRREAALQIALADRNFEAAELRKEVATAHAATEPTLLQLRQLLLDPAVNREFIRMRAELDDAQRELKRVQEELAVAHFTPDSKVGRQLMAKCRSLADENDQMGAELAEGKIQTLEAQLALSRSHAEELVGQVADLVEHCSALNEEVEALQREAFALRRKVKDYETEGPPDFQGRMMMGGPGEMGGMPHHGMMTGRGYRGRGRGPFRGRGGMMAAGGGVPIRGSGPMNNMMQQGGQPMGGQPMMMQQGGSGMNMQGPR